jgi:DNA polymerase-3 subunit alpha
LPTATPARWAILATEVLWKPEALASVKARLAEAAETAPPGRRGRGPVNLVLMAPDLPGEVEMTLPGDFFLTPRIAGAIKAAPGVVAVEEF